MGGAVASKQNVSDFEQAVENISLSQDNRIHAFLESTTTPPASPLPDHGIHPMKSHEEVFSHDDADGDSTMEERSQESLEVTSLVDDTEESPRIDVPRVSPLSTPRGALPRISLEEGIDSLGFSTSKQSPPSGSAHANRPLSGGRPSSAGPAAFIHKPAPMVSSSSVHAIMTPRSRPQSAREMNLQSEQDVTAEEAKEAFSELLQRSPPTVTQETASSTEGSQISSVPPSSIEPPQITLGRLQLGSRNGRKDSHPHHLPRDNSQRDAPLARFGTSLLSGGLTLGTTASPPPPAQRHPQPSSLTADAVPSLRRVDSFNDEFKYDNTSVVLAMRQQRVQAALENMQLEREVEELRSQLQNFEQRPPSLAAVVPRREEAHRSDSMHQRPSARPAEHLQQQQHHHHHRRRQVPPTSSSGPISSHQHHARNSSHEFYQQHAAVAHEERPREEAEGRRRQQQQQPSSGYPDIGKLRGHNHSQRQHQNHFASQHRSDHDASDYSESASSSSAQRGNNRSHGKGGGTSTSQQTHTTIALPDPRPTGGGGGTPRHHRRMRHRREQQQQQHEEGEETKDDEEGRGGERANLWSRSMEVRSDEVEFMLRRPVASNEDIQYTLAAAEAGLLFMEQMETTSRSLGVPVGQLSRWILPFGSSNQSVADQKSRAREAMENIPPELRPRMSDKEVAYLVRGANSVRKLIRVKIADDNDLMLAKESLLMTARFFRRLCDIASDLGLEPSELLRRRRTQGVATSVAAAAAASCGGGGASVGSGSGRGDGRSREPARHQRQGLWSTDKNTTRNGRHRNAVHAR